MRYIKTSSVWLIAIGFGVQLEVGISIYLCMRLSVGNALKFKFKWLVLSDQTKVYLVLTESFQFYNWGSLIFCFSANRRREKDDGMSIEGYESLRPTLYPNPNTRQPQYQSSNHMVEVRNEQTEKWYQICGVITYTIVWYIPVPPPISSLIRNFIPVGVTFLVKMNWWVFESSPRRITPNTIPCKHSRELNYPNRPELFRSYMAFIKQTNNQIRIMDI